jgi:hypothetical protein
MKPSPLSILEVLESQQKLKVFQPLLGGAVRRSPPGLDGKVPRLRLEYRRCVATLEVETFVLVLQIVLDIDFSVFLQRLGPIEVAGSLASIDGNLRISRSVDNPNGIPIGLCTVRNEAFEVRLGDAMMTHDVIKVMPKKHLSIIVFGLEVAVSNGHDSLVGFVAYVAGHNGPLGDVFDMVGHDPSMLKIPARLHALNRVDPTIRADLRHLENKILFVSSPWPRNSFRLI